MEILSQENVQESWRFWIADPSRDQEEVFSGKTPGPKVINRTYLKHVEKLREIYSSPRKSRNHIKSNLELINRIGTNKSRDHKYHAAIKKNQVAYENKILITRIHQISKGNYVTYIIITAKPIEKSNP